MIEQYIWYAFFLIILSGYIFVQLKVRNRRKYLVYFISGALIGFLFDFISVTQGYYTYPSFYTINIAGVPILLNIAEGFSVAITIYLFEWLRSRLSKPGRSSSMHERTEL